ncbi:phytanoyl-CoA dioxygenase [Babesia caballi]|uniref:Phytanoyl-CoA dioxygenase n=1 Tax=Babesia caballi TaxID=5871 RepID=A0AAV4LT73_BABCB|nr:phytanoyl-CoA dioxygenase [Babesia caballi]
MGPRSRRESREVEIFAKNGSQLSHLVRVVSKAGGNDVPPRYIAVMVKALAVAGYRDPELVESLLQQLNMQEALMTTASIAILLDGLYTLGHRNNGILASISKQLKLTFAQQKGWDPGGQQKEGEGGPVLCKNAICWDNSDREVPRVSDWANTDNISETRSTALSTAVGKRCIVTHGREDSNFQGQIDQTRTQHLALIHRAYSYFGFYDRQLFDMLFRRMEVLYQQCKPLEIVMIANSMAKSKIHDGRLIELFSEKVYRGRRSYSVDMVTVFLHGICQPDNNNPALFDQMLSAIMRRRFAGEITAKNCLTLLQIIAKVKLTESSCTDFFVERIVQFHNELANLDLANAVAYITKIRPQSTELHKLVDSYFSLYNEKDAIRNAQHLAILFYALSRTDNGTFEKYGGDILDKLQLVPGDCFEPIHVANVLRVMATRELRNERMISEMSRYTEVNMAKFNAQLLGSCVDSLRSLSWISDALWRGLCKHVPKIKKKSSKIDSIRFLHFLATGAHPDWLESASAKFDILTAYDALVECIASTATQEPASGETKVGNNYTNSNSLQRILQECVTKIEEFKAFLNVEDTESMHLTAQLVMKLSNFVEGTPEQAVTHN